jgi:DNA modification methylase
MAKITLIHADSKKIKTSADLILTDPPYEMPGCDLDEIIANIESEHIVMLTTMRQLHQFLSSSNWELNFDFVFDCVAPKKSMNFQQPNYLHQTGVYLTKPGVKSIFDRRQRPRSDVFEGNHYWPTIIKAPRASGQKGYAKNEVAFTDLLGSFKAGKIVDPFAGHGTTGISCFTLDLECELIEKDDQAFNSMKQKFSFLAKNGLKIIEKGE